MDKKYFKLGQDKIRHVRSAGRGRWQWISLLMFLTIFTEIFAKLTGIEYRAIKIITRHRAVYNHLAPLPRRGCNRRSIFKWSRAGLNSEFTFSWAGCLTKAKETRLFFYLVWKEEMDSCLSQGYYRRVKRKRSQPKIELESPVPFSTMITVTIRAFLYCRCNLRFTGKERWFFEVPLLSSNKIDWF